MPAGEPLPTTPPNFRGFSESATVDRPRSPTGSMGWAHTHDHHPGHLANDPVSDYRPDYFPNHRPQKMSMIFNWPALLARQAMQQQQELDEAMRTPPLDVAAAINAPRRRRFVSFSRDSTSGEFLAVCEEGRAWYETSGWIEGVWHEAIVWIEVSPLPEIQP